MSRRKTEKQLKKLKKHHIWPSILSFVLTIGMVSIVGEAGVALTLVYVAEQEYSTDYNNADYIVRKFENDYARGLSLEDTLDQIEGREIFVVDSENRVLAGRGELTAELDNDVTLPFDNSVQFYLDHSESEWYNADKQTLKIPVKKIMGKSFEGWTDGSQVGDGRLTEWLHEDISKIDYWLVRTSEDGSYKLIIKDDVVFQRKDVLYVTVLLAAIALILLIPLTFMLGKVIDGFKTQKQMMGLLYLDQTTGGNNWMYFKNNGRKILKKSKTTYAVVDLQLRKYRNYCVYHGAEEGERLLEEIYTCINRNLGRKEICTRYSGSDFAILMRCDGVKSAKRRLEGMISDMSDIMGSRKSIFHIGFEIEEPFHDRYISLEDVDIEGMYNRASTARASIADHEDSGIVSFTEEMFEEQLWEQKVEEEQQHALDDEQFLVYYQPKYDPVTEKLAGAEALIRWVYQGKLVPPGKFIPIFERNGFIMKIDDYMIDHVARQQAQWYKEGRNIVPVSVNVSRAHFAQEDLAEHIQEIVDRYDIPHRFLEIELTESAFFDDKNALLTTVNRLKSYGFDVSMDDFGSGYSSLNSLKDLPLDVLKLDADFFRGEDRGERGDIVVKEAIMLAKQLEMRIVAEGIEKKEQVKFLAEAGCDMIQGYYFAKPMPVADYEERMALGVSVPEEKEAEKAEDAVEQSVTEEKAETEKSEKSEEKSEAEKTEDMPEEPKESETVEKTETVGEKPATEKKSEESEKK